MTMGFVGFVFSFVQIKITSRVFSSFKMLEYSNQNTVIFEKILYKNWDSLILFCHLGTSPFLRCAPYLKLQLTQKAHELTVPYLNTSYFVFGGLWF